MRIVTTTEQLLYDLLQEQKRTNELLEKLIPKESETPLVIDKPVPTVKRGR
jgi:hypothetical protein